MLNGVLLALAVALAAAFGHVSQWGDAFSVAAGARTDRATAARGGDLGLLPDFRLTADAANYGQISQRPVFNPTRAPAPTAPAVATTEPPKPSIRRGLYQLVGIIDLGVGKIAQVKELATNRTQTVRVGDSLQEMKVTAITADGIRLAFAGETDDVRLAKFTPSGRVPQPVAAAVVPPPVTPQAAPAVRLPGQLPMSPTPVAMATPVQSIAPSPQAVAQATVPVTVNPVARAHEYANEPTLTPQEQIRRQAVVDAWGGKL